MKTHSNSLMKRNQGIFSCGACKRKTRDTGDNGGVDLCPECYEWCGLDNQVNDGGYETAEEKTALLARIAQLKALAVSKGGSL